MKNSAREEYKTGNFDLIPLKMFALFSQVGNKSKVIVSGGQVDFVAFLFEAIVNHLGLVYISQL